MADIVPLSLLSVFSCNVFVNFKCKGFIIAHQVIVVMWDEKEVWVHKEPHLVSIETGEHLANSWNCDLPLVKPVPFFSEEDTVCNRSVGVSVCVMVQANHIAFCEIVEDYRGDECEEADDSTKNCLQGKALHTQSSFKQNFWHNKKTEPTGAVREKLYP